MTVPSPKPQFERVILDNLRFEVHLGGASSKGWPLPHDAIKELMGLPRKLPANQSTLPVLIGNVYVWLIDRPNNARRQHRIFAACPNCSWYVPAGRLSQHLNTKACK